MNSPGPRYWSLGLMKFLGLEILDLGSGPLVFNPSSLVLALASLLLGPDLGVDLESVKFWPGSWNLEHWSQFWVFVPSPRYITERRTQNVTRCTNKRHHAPFSHTQTIHPSVQVKKPRCTKLIRSFLITILRSTQAYTGKKSVWKKDNKYHRTRENIPVFLHKISKWHLQGMFYKKVPLLYEKITPEKQNEMKNANSSWKATDDVLSWDKRWGEDLN